MRTASSPSGVTPAVEQRLVRLFRALHDGAAPRSGRLGRRRTRRRLSLARPDARRPGDRLFPARRRAAAGLALRPPASRRDDGRMVDGRRAREAARRCRSGHAPAAREGDLPHRPQHEPGRIEPRPSAHQRGRHQPQPRMARRRAPSAARKCSTSATRWTRPASISRWTSMATRRSPPISSPASRAFRAGTRSSRRLFDAFSAALVARSRPISRPTRAMRSPSPGKANLSMSTAQLAERFGAVSMTLEMPFKDNADLPDPVYGWSPDRCRAARPRLPRRAPCDPAPARRSAGPPRKR